MEIITRNEALERGLKRFFIDKKCGFGHLAERLVSNGSCVICHKDRAAKWRKNNPDKVSEQNSSYHSRHKEKINGKKYAERASKRESDPLFAEIERMRGLIKASITNKGYSKRTRTAEILGCSWDTFRSHIERQFLRGMNWGNRRLWHIDHITPMSSAETYEDAVRLNHYTNLRPIWASDNLKKNGKAIFLI